MPSQTSARKSRLRGLVFGRSLQSFSTVYVPSHERFHPECYGLPRRNASFISGQCHCAQALCNENRPTRTILLCYLMGAGPKFPIGHSQPTPSLSLSRCGP